MYHTVLTCSLPELQANSKLHISCSCSVAGFLSAALHCDNVCIEVTPGLIRTDAIACMFTSALHPYRCLRLAGYTTAQHRSAAPSLFKFLRQEAPVGIQPRGPSMGRACPSVLRAPQPCPGPLQEHPLHSRVLAR